MSGAHEAKLIEISYMYYQKGLARPCELTQDLSTCIRFGNHGIGKALELLTLIGRSGCAPELIFILDDGIATLIPLRWNDEWLTDTVAK